MLALAAALPLLGTLLCCGSEAGTSAPCRGKTTLAASGSSAQTQAIDRFDITYSTICRGYSVDYTPTASAAGRAEFISGKTDFGGSDSPLGRAPGEAEKAGIRCGGHDAWNLPLVFSAIAIIYNLAGVDSLVLDAQTAAKIFNGSIRQWDAPEIAALNPGQDLPSTPIVVIARSDESGTTENFQNYLSAAAGPVWGKGTGETFNGAAAASAEGNEGAWATMRHLAGSITYAAWPFAKVNGLPTAGILTPASSEPVTLTADSVSRSIANVAITTGGNDIVLDTSALFVPNRPDAYPIVMATYETVCSTYPDPQVGAAVRNFLTAALAEGQRDLSDGGYVPVPGSVSGRLITAIGAIS
jgi:phosphate transport system substrate-binding protein